METIINKFPEEVTIDILLRLPVKSLLQFKCVCKIWCNLIEDPDFIVTHFSHSIAENDHYVLIKRCLQDRVTNVLSIHSNTESLNIVLPDLQIPYLNSENVQLLGPCNGLVCMTNYEIIVLCNPAIREFTLLPGRPFGCPQDMYYTNKGVGFGFDVNTNNCTVIRILKLVDNDDYTFYTHKAEVYRRSTDSWREVDYTLPHVWHYVCFEIFFNGATHWYATREGIERVLSFNIATEMFQEFEFPDSSPFVDGDCKSLTILNESLALIFCTGPWVRTYEQLIDIFVMRKYGVPESWTKHFTIGPLSMINHPITSWKNFALFLARTSGQLISCALDTQEVKEFDIVAYRDTLRALVYKKFSFD